MDIHDLYTAPLHDKGAEVQIRNPITGDLTDCYINVIGVDSKKFRSLQKERRRAVLDAIREDTKLEDDEFQLLVDSTLGWRGFTHKGKELKFDKENLLALYTNSPKIAEQVDKFMADRKNFT